MKKILVLAYLLFLNAIAFANKPDTLVIGKNKLALLTNIYFNELEDTNGSFTIKQVYKKYWFWRKQKFLSYS